MPVDVYRHPLQQRIKLVRAWIDLSKKKMSVLMVVVVFHIIFDPKLHNPGN